MESQRGPDWVRRVLDAGGAVLVMGLSILSLWQNRRWIDTDTVAYADLSDALLRGDWVHSFNGYFSPAWAWLIAAGRLVFGVSAAREAPIVRALQSAIIVLTTLQVRRLLRELRCWSSEAPRNLLLDANTVAGTVVFWGAAVFAIARLSSGHSNPDALLTCLTVGASAELLVMRRTLSPRRAVALGAWLAATYWTKGVALPIGLGFLLATALCASRERRARLVAAVAVTTAVLAAPLAIMLSVKAGRIDVGDTGRLTMAWFAAGVSAPTPDPTAAGTASLVHLWRRVVNDPPVFAYPVGVEGTYPPWTDPVYWQEGLAARPTVRQLMLNVQSTTAQFWNFYFGALLMGVVLAAACVGGFRVSSPDVSVALALPAMAAVASYLAILFEPRYFAPIFLLAVASVMTLSVGNGRRWPWLVLATAAAIGWSLPTWREMAVAIPCALAVDWSLRTAPAARRCAVAVLVTLIASTTPEVLRALVDGGVMVAKEPAEAPATVAAALARVGVVEGTRIATVGVIGPGFYWTAWARRARLRIVAEIPRGFETTFWSGPTSGAEVALDAMRAAGAQLVVARVPRDTTDLGPAWRRVEGTDLAIRALR